MEIAVRDNRQQQRFEILADGQVAGIMTYREEAGSLALDHTEVDDRYAGQGLASHLVGAALDEIRARGRTVVPYCPFVRTFINEHPEDADLVA